MKGLKPRDPHGQLRTCFQVRHWVTDLTIRIPTCLLQHCPEGARLAQGAQRGHGTWARGQEFRAYDKEAQEVQEHSGVLPMHQALHWASHMCDPDD